MTEPMKPASTGPDGPVASTGMTGAAGSPDPVAYDEPRNVRARIKGLPGPVITGGDDPDPAAGLREERYYGRLLVAMIAILILGGFVIGLAIALAQA